MNKIIVSLALWLGILKADALYAQANELYYSPYSYYGLGDRVPNNSLRNRALGSIAIGNASPINLIPDNPASYAELRQTTLEFSSSLKASLFQTDSLSINRFHMTFDGIMLGFPSNKKFCLAMGLIPFTKSGYKVRQLSDLIAENDTLKLLTIRSGDGGINKVFLGIGMPLLKNKLYLGTNLHYYFGNLSRYKETAYLKEGFINTMVRNRTHYQGWAYQAGIMYSDSIGKSRYRIGASYHGSFRLKTQQTNEYYDVLIGVYETLYQPFDTLEQPASSFSHPSIWAVGIGMESLNHYAWGLDFQFYDGSKLPPQHPDVSFQKAFWIRTGLEWTPKFSDDNYWKKVAYRIGAYFHQSELKILNQSIQQTALTFGLGFPFRRTLSRLNLFWELGQKGTLKPQLVKELYFSFGVGVTFNETWFIKRKLD